jgi:hypothetical protein
MADSSLNVINAVLTTWFLLLYGLFT